jgi:hypothetical protein
MELRRTAGMAAGVFALVVVAAAPAKKPPPTGGGGSGPTAPSNLRITGSTATSVSLAWNGSTGNSFWYCVQRDLGGCIRVDPPQTSITLTRLISGTTFHDSVYAIDAGGNRSGNSNSVSYTTPPDVTAPSPPPTLSATAVYPTRVTLAWTSSTDDTSSQVWYTLHFDGVAHDESVFRNSNLVQDLAPGSTHTFKVTVRDAVGNVAASNVLTVTTPTTTDATAPSAPTNLRLGPQSGGCEAWLSWNASTDDADAQSLIQYDVYVNGVRTPDGVIGYTSTVAYARAVGLTTFVIKAVDTSGNISAPSNDVTLDALPC